MFAPPERRTFKEKPPQAYFATDFLEQMYKTTPGIKAKFSGVALHPYTGSYQKLTAEIEEVRAVLQGQRRRRQEPLDHRARLELRSRRASDGSNAFAKGPAGQATQLKGAFSLLERNQVKWKLQRVYWFSVDDAPGACNFCDGSGLFGHGFVPKKSWFAYVKFAGGTP